MDLNGNVNSPILGLGAWVLALASGMGHIHSHKQNQDLTKDLGWVVLAEFGFFLFFFFWLT